MTSTTIAPGDALFLDTNVLLTATARLLHADIGCSRAGQRRGSSCASAGRSCASTFSVATRPLDANGLALAMADARHNIEAIFRRTRLLEETRAVLQQLMASLRRARIAGKRAHDLGIVATAEAHGVGKLLTDNVVHFRGLGKLELIDLAALPAL
jgi:predicted nucleic acid-binding protein